MSDEILKNWICTKPFNYLDVNHYGSYMCCPSWLPEDITNHKTPDEVSITEGWFSEKSERIRESMLDGSFRYCDHKVCPEISAVLGGKTTESKHMLKKENFTPPEVPMVEHILYGQDRSCNLRCPSCRLNVIPNDRLDSPEHKRKQEMQDEIEKSFGSTIKHIMLTGSGDPIYSKIYRDFLINFDKTKYPALEEIQIVTNGVLLNEKMWNSFNCKEFINIFDISFDAGCKETYENSTRIGGDWDRLLENIRFLTSLTDMKRKFIFSYVVSEHNYKEMNQCLEIVDEITQGTIHAVTVNFRQHLYWESGAYTPDQVKEIAVFDPEHRLHEDFLKELYIMNQHPGVNHNFHHLL